jgi:hypothetical protein
VTTTRTSVRITCPPWCTVDPQDHAENLWNSGGNCCHHAPDVSVEDAEGRPPVCVTFSTCTSPEGREVAAPVIYINDREHSIEQALALAEAITRAVDELVPPKPWDLGAFLGTFGYEAPTEHASSVADLKRYVRKLSDEREAARA